VDDDDDDDDDVHAEFDQPVPMPSVTLPHDWITS